MIAMLRHPAASARAALIAAALVLALAGCGIKGPLVPARKAGETPPPATTTPQVPSATLPSNAPPPP
jgi:predicted small lipoprotein YifL